jgi:hypothetical protein
MTKSKTAEHVLIIPERRVTVEPVKAPSTKLKSLAELMASVDSK